MEWIATFLSRESDDVNKKEGEASAIFGVGDGNVHNLVNRRYPLEMA